MSIKLVLTNLNYVDSRELKALANYLLEIANFSNDQPTDKCGTDTTEEMRPEPFKAYVRSETDQANEEEQRIFGDEDDDTDTLAPETIFNDATAELDSAGNAWDERIHSRTKSLLADGTWKLKRGVNEKLVRQILKPTPLSFLQDSAQSIKSTFISPRPPAAPSIPIPNTELYAVPMPVAPVQNIPLPTPAITFESTIARLTDAINLKIMTHAQAIGLANQVGVKILSDFAIPDNQHLLAPYNKLLDEIVGV